VIILYNENESYFSSLCIVILFLNFNLKKCLVICTDCCTATSQKSFGGDDDGVSYGLYEIHLKCLIQRYQSISNSPPLGISMGFW
jgi:hypothetical protein